MLICAPLGKDKEDKDKKDDEEKDKDGKKKETEESKSSKEEPLFEMLANPARVMKPQLRVVELAEVMHTLWFIRTH